MKAIIYDNIRAVQWVDGRVRLLDQRLLPHEVRYLDLSTSAEVAAAITDMVVRGAPAIGITAAYGVVLAAAQRYGESAERWRQPLQEDMDTLLRARPTAVNLRWAVKRLSVIIDTLKIPPLEPLLAQAKRIHAQDIAANQRIGTLGASLLSRDSVLTHCNAGALATGGYGTALGVIRSAWAAGKINKVYADETRPWLQGSRLTAWELLQEGIPVTLICEGAAAALMRERRPGWVIVGADRVAANGDVANKIGTYSLAVIARAHGVRFMVAAPTSTVDMDMPSGDGIEIEQRQTDEVLTMQGKPIAAPGATAWNSVFDVTPASLVDALVTEQGIIHNPDTDKLKRLMNASS
ncbi:MAG: S-methyl-5-thioribose-1-phosphate isomerase [Pseudomonadota bacterium]